MPYRPTGLPTYLGRLTPDEIERKAMGFCRRVRATGRPWRDEFERWALRYWTGLHWADLSAIEATVHAELFARSVTTDPPHDLAA